MTQQTSQSDLEDTLYQKFGMEPLSMKPKEIFQLLCAFWPHFALHKRICDKTGKSIISVFDKNCPYPVWHKEEWIKEADPPSADYDPSEPFFGQLWKLFQQCPIPHNVGSNNENCEYTDDWWYGKNCYLCHSGVECEDNSYCFRTLKLKDCQFCVFAFRSERSTDLINVYDCYATLYALNSRQCRDSAFLFDCRNCSDCLFSWNLRNKQYCIFNEQLSKEEYEKRRAEYDFSSRQQYEEAKKQFYDILRSKAWWKNTDQDQCQDCSGSYQEQNKNCQNSFFISDGEDCVNTMRAGWIKDNLNVVGSYKNEMVYMSSMAQNNCYDIRCCYNVMQSKQMEYSAHCFNSQNCFGCCGLTNKQYHIFNKPYSKEEYESKVSQIREQLKKEGVYGQFFPKYFAACPYDESLAGFYWPLSKEEQREQGFRVKKEHEEQQAEYTSPESIPDNSQEADPSICKKSFWDPIAKRPFQINAADLKFCQENKVPLPNSYYIRRIKENYRFIFFNGEQRETTCAKTGKTILTTLPPELDNRIISMESYLDMIG